MNVVKNQRAHKVVSLAELERGMSGSYASLERVGRSTSIQYVWAMKAKCRLRVCAGRGRTC